MPPDLAELIRSGRLRKGLNLEALAEQAGVSRTTVHHLERGGTHRPRASTLSRLAAVLDIDPDQMAEGWQPPSPLAESAASSSPSDKLPSADRTPASPSPTAMRHPAEAFDWSTNSVLRELLAESPDQYPDVTPDEWQELASQFGVGGALTRAGLDQAIEQLRADRETVTQLRILLQTHLRDSTRQLIDALYRSLLVTPETVSSGRTPPSLGGTP